MHPRDADGRESLRPAVIAAAITAIRAAAPEMPVGVSTGAWIEPDPERLLAHVRAWAALPANERPDYASVNCSEPGARDVMAALTAAGIGIEAGVAKPEEVGVLAGATLLRVLVEPEAADAAAALALAGAIERALVDAGLTAPQLHHGLGPATWVVLRAAAARGLDVRVGLEDVLVLPDGTRAEGNAELVAALARAVER